MTKQEEIRGGIAKTIASQSHTLPKFRRTLAWESLLPTEREHCLFVADEIMAKERSQGVVIKVDKELPKVILGSKMSVADKIYKTAVWEYAQSVMLRAGYVAVEPLIEEL